MLRHRARLARLARLRTLLRNRVRAVLAGHGHGRPAGGWSGPGWAWLAASGLPAVSREVTDDALALTGALQQPAGRLDAEVRGGRRPRAAHSDEPRKALGLARTRTA
jgi:transposase